MILALFIIFFILLLLNIPVAFVLVLSSLLFILIEQIDLPLMVVTQRMLTGIDSFPFLAIPFFMLAGELMNKGRLGMMLVDFSKSLIGWVNGGLAAVTILGNMFLAGISGSSVADASALGTLMIPAMEREGYSKKFATAVNSVAATVGVIIPPSIPMVIYGVIAGVSIGDLFIAGAVPGIMVGFFMIIITTLISKKRNYAVANHFSLKTVFIEFRRSLLALIVPGIILGGIIGGFFTPTEASVVAVVYAFVIEVLVLRDISLRECWQILISVAISSSVILIVIAAASVFSWLLAFQNIPAALAQWLSSFNSVILVMALINVVLLITGCFIDMGPAIIIFAPVLLPTVKIMGIDPLHFGVIMVFNLAIGLSTPPIGTTLFISSHIAQLKVLDVAKEAAPMLIASLIVLFLISYIPQLSMALPNLLGF